MAEWADQFIIIFNVFIAVILTGIVGLERELSSKPAGFRTNMIIGGATSLLLSLGHLIINYYADTGVSEYLQTDPIRIIEAIILGVSFIGAGTILKVQQEGRISNLTTAATILFSAGIGMAVGLEQYVLAMGVTGIILSINFLLGKVEKWIEKKKEQ